MDKRTSRFAVGAVIVAAAGYVAGVLTAPKSGKETREDIKQAASSGITEAEKRLKNIHTDLSEAIDKASKREDDKSEQTSAEPIIAKAMKVKEKVRHALSSIHDGETSDEDLKQAIVDAEAAIQNLKKYLSK